jgi:hypothetical protein
LNNLSELRAEAYEALDSVWFIQSLEEVDHTDISLSLRLHIRQGLFVQLFYGNRSDSLYFALIENDRRIFGIDRERNQWHMHPFETPDAHLPLGYTLEPKPLLTFLAKVEALLLANDLF